MRDQQERRTAMGYKPSAIGQNRKASREVLLRGGRKLSLRVRLAGD
jgi:hypothetical protein